MKKKTMKIKFKVHIDEVFLTILYFYWDCSKKDAKDHIEQKLGVNLEIDMDEFNDAESWSFCDNSCSYYVIWIEDKKDFYALSHEITHTVFKVFQRKGVPISYENQETFAYYHDYWLRTLWKEMNEKVRV